MRKCTLKFTVLIAGALLGCSVWAQQEADEHTHLQDTDERPRFTTSRVSGIELPLTDEEDSFFFVVYGDRTGGPADGVRVLAQAVTDTNLLKPDFVMTVGDLIQGYNATDLWMTQMREFKGIMGELDCPWYPVAGNHDIYWRGRDRPEHEHEANYEEHFGPLWYAFFHKKCWFIILHSDEGDDEGRFTFNRPASQTMSDEQFEWLSQTLDDAADAPHVFVFLHHPRWHGGGYGNDWARVHDRLVDAGNVTAVFAGHIHRMSYDGLRDGIEYVTLATTGGGQSGRIPAAGYLQHYDIVTVRGEALGLAAVEVGAMIDVRAVTPEVTREAEMLSQSLPQFLTSPAISQAGVGSGELSVVYHNPTSRPVDLTVYLDSADSRWRGIPDHQHGRLEPGESKTLRFEVSRVPAGLDEAYRKLELVIQADYLAEGLRIPIPEQRHEVPVSIELPAVDPPDFEQVLQLDGDDALVVPSGAFEMHDGPLTIECWVRPDRLAQRTGVIGTMEMSEYGLMVSDNQLMFSVYLGDAYVSATADRGALQLDRWQHLAGVFDGEELRLYIDGHRVATQPGTGPRRTNTLPFVIGGDVNGRGEPTSMLAGQMDGVRVSNTARYAGDFFEPQRRYETDEHTLLLQQMDGMFLDFYLDASARGPHAKAWGDPVLVEAATDILPMPASE